MKTHHLKEEAAKYADGDKITTYGRDIERTTLFHPQYDETRVVTYEIKNGNPGIRVNHYWFNWEFYFEVNGIVPGTKS